MAETKKKRTPGENFAEAVNGLIGFGKACVPGFEENELSDGWHTFNDLYNFRKLYNAALFNEWALSGDGNGNPKYNVHKSMRHNDGELCFGGGWFIVVALLPAGQITNHYKIKDWDLFHIPVEEKALYPFDEHTPHDVMDRLSNLINPEKSNPCNHGK